METNLKVHFSSTKDDWETPPEFFAGIEKIFGKFDFDAAASTTNHKCEVFLSPELDYNALEMDWKKNVVSRPSNGTTIRVWMNPPYSKPENKCGKNCSKKRCAKRGFHNEEYKPGQIDFIKKAILESREGIEVIALIPARPDTKIFQLCYENAREILFVRGRLQFVGASAPAPFPSMVVRFHGTWSCDDELQAPVINFVNTKGELI